MNDKFERTQFDLYILTVDSEVVYLFTAEGAARRIIAKQPEEMQPLIDLTALIGYLEGMPKGRNKSVFEIPVGK